MAKPALFRTLLGELPFLADLEYRLRPAARNRAGKDRYNLHRLQNALPGLVQTAAPFAASAPAGKRVLFFATLHYWIEQSAVIALTLAALGHRVTLLTLPYAEWHKEIDKLTLRRRLLHTRDALAALSPLVEHLSLLDLRPAPDLPPDLQRQIEQISHWDAQYTLMREEVNLADPADRALYHLRRKRNQDAARAALTYLQDHRPEVILIPNGLILEMGAVFRTAHFLGLPTVTYEFNDQREQIWLAHNSPIMQQDTDFLVTARLHLPMTEEMYQRLADLENARRGARVWGKSKRLWQYVSTQGAEATRRALGLDDRPVVMLAANVLGDSLTLGRDLFANSMTEWITHTVRFFADHAQVQLVIRVHPGETLVPQAKSMEQVVRQALPVLPEHIHIVRAADPINTYDLIEIADLGLAYTTTVGLETAMNGVPVIVCGRTHYRGRGFTLDPNSWEEYFALLERILADPAAYRLSDDQIALAWNYAYRFFFEYPRPFPWRLMNFWDDLNEWPLERVLSPEGRARFGETFRFLVGEPFTWND